MNVDHLTDNPEVRKAWSCPDAGLQTMHRTLPHVPLSSRSDYKECIRLHHDYIESGLVNIPWQYQEELQRLDPYLRLRYDLQCQCYIIERVDTDLRAWVRLFRWANEDGSAKSLSTQAVREMIDKLHAGDMRRFDSPQEYLEHKRQKATKIQTENDRVQTDRLMEVIDGMSTKQINEFVAVEKAIASGEKINPTGQDAATMNMWYEMGRTGQAPTDDLPSPHEAINPGHDPLRIQGEQGI